MNDNSIFTKLKKAPFLNRCLNRSLEIVIHYQVMDHGNKIGEVRLISQLIFALGYVFNEDKNGRQKYITDKVRIIRILISITLKA